MEISRVGVVGLGTMGSGIAQVCIQSGLEVVGREVSPELGEQARRRIDHYLSRGVEKGRFAQDEKDAALTRLCLVTDLAELASCQLVIEAAFEDLEVKRGLFADLEAAVAHDAILATNTSALSVTQIAAATDSPERVVGMHFFNPAPVLPLVEVIRTAQTSDDVFDAAYAFAQRIGKEPVACNDTPGFIVNRILIPLLNDCVRVLDEARVAPDDVARADRPDRHRRPRPRLRGAPRGARRGADGAAAAPARDAGVGPPRPQERPRLLRIRDDITAAQALPQPDAASRAQTLSTKRETIGFPIEAAKLIAPASKTFAPAGVS